jgi:glycosyltransferase involved in cell wall biosynthesis
MTVSVIIPTYNGVKKLPGIIRSLEQQSFNDFDVVVAVDGSTDHTLTYLRSIKTVFPLTVLEQPNSGRSAIRNKGAEVAQGDLLIFFDDDMLPLERCIELHVQHHARYPGSILTGGLKEYASTHSTEIEKYKSSLSEKWISPLRKDPEQKLNKESIFITAANFSISRSLFKMLGGFDESFNDAEDFDLAVRAYKGSVPLYFNYDAFAWHNETVSCASYIRRQRQYNKAHKTLIELKPWLKSEGFITPNIQPVGLRKKIFNVFTSGFWVKAADKGLFKVLPKKLRYKLYDIIITANGVHFPEKVNL